jgi:hypothetical protein
MFGIGNRHALNAARKRTGLMLWNLSCLKSVFKTVRNESLELGMETFLWS